MNQNNSLCRIFCPLFSQKEVDAIAKEQTGGAIKSGIETLVLNGPGRIRTYDQWIMGPKFAS